MNKTQSIQNLFTYGASQIISLLAPFLVGFYVIPIFGIAKWGVIGVATSLYIVIGILIEFGANLVGVKELSAHRLKYYYKKRYIGLNYTFRLYCTVFITLLLIICFVLFNADTAFYWGLTWMLAWYFNPLWVYQANENFKIINFITIATKIIYIVVVYLFIKQPQHYIYIVGLLGFCNALFYAFFYFKIPKTITNIKRVWLFVNQNKAIVLSNFSITAYTQAPIFIIDALLGNTASGIYKVIDLFLTAYRSYLGVFFNVTFPRFCFEAQQNLKAAKTYVSKMLFLNVFLLTLSALFIFIAMPYVTQYFNVPENVQKGLHLSRFLLFLPVIIALNIPFYQALIYNSQNISIAFISIGGLLLTLLSVGLLTYFFNLSGSFAALYIVELFITLCLFAKGSKYLK
ncbi:oligosaccharide flippase family protein [Flavobacterium sp. CBA20B-1]|uniref:lipopolysaccharide biosynthesis protein n=1 Tax=unclassified Flavobacterium TaxID=196869 RepID=UPI00222509AE|nr:MULTISPECIES: oligosaccharide flippase family protein [unclassified Flavobacterium]WCM41193.1 oligosaccharide flippase family protein [Flavobacterium sp. CBA20B-1]